MSELGDIVVEAQAPRRRVGIRLLRSREAALLLICLAFAALISRINADFATVDNFRVIIENMALQSIVMAAMVMLMVAGRFDLSVDGVASLSGIVAGELMASLNVAPLLAVLAGFTVGITVGLINGFAIERLGMNPLMTTLATWWACSGASLGVTGGTSPYNFPSSFTTFGQTTLLGLNVTVWYAVLLLPLLGLVLSFTKFGYHTFATGGDRRAARLHGVKVARVGIVLYVVVGISASFAGILYTARLGTASPVVLDGMNLQVIAAAVIGGASLSGGEGSVIGGVLGLLLLNMLGDAAIYVGISPYWQKAISGVVLFLAVAADGIMKSRSPVAPGRPSLMHRLQDARWLLARQPH